MNQVFSRSCIVKHRHRGIKGKIAFSADLAGNILIDATTNRTGAFFHKIQFGFTIRANNLMAVFQPLSTNQTSRWNYQFQEAAKELFPMRQKSTFHLELKPYLWQSVQDEASSLKCYAVHYKCRQCYLTSHWDCFRYP